MAMTFDELREYFVENLLNATKIPADKLNELVDELLTTCEFNLDELTETFKGSASTSTNPGTPAGRVWYLTEGPGTYTNFLDSESDPIEVTELFGMLIYNGSEWELTEHEISVDLENYLTTEETIELFKEIGKNKFDKTAITTGKYVNSVNGTLGNNASYNATDYIPVDAESDYYRNKNSNGGYQAYHYAWYDSDKVFISGANAYTNALTAPENASYIRYSLVVADYEEDQHQFEEGNEPTDYEAYVIRFKKDDIQVSNENFLGELSEEKIDSEFRASLFTTGKNKFDKDMSITSGYYVVYNNGNLSSNANYDASDYIAIGESTQYFRSPNSHTYHIAFYDEDKVYISGINNSNQSFQSPAGAAFMRTSLVNTIPYDIDQIQIEEGEESTVYEAFRTVKKLEESQVNLKDVDDTIKGMFGTRIIIPNVVYATVGEQLQIFYKSIIEAIDPYAMDVVIATSLSGVVQYKRYFEVTPVSAGDYSVNMKIYNHTGTLVAEKDFSINVKAKGSLPASDLYILTIGDSLSNAGEWQKPLRDKIISDYGAATHLEWIGRLTHSTDPNVKYEATAGYSWSTYIGASSPFGSPLNFSDYITTYGSGVDLTGSNLLIFILLGWNGLKNGRIAVHHKQTIDYAKTLIDHIHSAYEDATIVIISPNLGQQLIMGIDTSSYYSRFRTNQRIWGLCEAYQDWCNETGYSDFMEYIGMHQSFDSEHGCLSSSQFAEKAVNKWQTGITEQVPDVSDWIHPNESRFIMDVAYNYLVNKYLD